MDTNAKRLLDSKVTVLSSRSDEEWLALPQSVREESFYVPGIIDREIVEEFRKEIGRIAQGESSVPESERRLCMYLDGIGYQAPGGAENTLADLRFWEGMRRVISTNVELLQGWGKKERGMSRVEMMAFPAWELIRFMPRSEPRDWPTRFTLSGGEIRDGRMIAMKDSAVWQELGNFEDGLHVDYPPFAWGSGMGWKAIGYREADKLGVIPPDWMPPPRISLPTQKIVV